MTKLFELNDHLVKTFDAYDLSTYLRSSEYECQKMEFLNSLNELKDCLYSEKSILTVEKATDLIVDWERIFRLLLIDEEESVVREVFQIKHMLLAHIDQYSPHAEKIFDFLTTSLDELYETPLPGMHDDICRKLIESVLPLAICPTAAALMYKYRVYMIMSEIMIRDDQEEKALFFLLEAYSCLIDSVFQTTPSKDAARLRLMKDIHRALERNNKDRLANWVRKKIDIVKKRNPSERKSPVSDLVQESSVAKSQSGWPCAAFAMEDSQEAYMHLRDYECVKHYGEGENGRNYVFDEGYRVLCRCRKCGGYFLLQRSELHGGEGGDAYYGDYFPVSSPESAESLIEKFDGWQIERHFPGRYLVETDGLISWYDLHIQENEE